MSSKSRPDAGTRSAAQNILAELERKAERIWIPGLITNAEAKTADHLTRRPIAEHVEAYVASLEASGVSRRYAMESRRILDAVVSGCEYLTLADLDRGVFQQWLNRRRADDASARIRGKGQAT